MEKQSFEKTMFECIRYFRPKRLPKIRHRSIAFICGIDVECIHEMARMTAQKLKQKELVQEAFQQQELTDYFQRVPVVVLIEAIYEIMSEQYRQKEIRQLGKMSYSQYCERDDFNYEEIVPRKREQYFQMWEKLREYRA